MCGLACAKFFCNLDQAGFDWNLVDRNFSVCEHDLADVCISTSTCLPASVGACVDAFLCGDCLCGEKKVKKKVSFFWSFIN